MKKIIIFETFVLFLTPNNYKAQSLTYPVVDTDQHNFYNNTSQISQPDESSSFFGQDAQYNGLQPSYSDNGDGTITDNNTGLMWQKNLLESKYNYYEAVEAADTFSLAGYNDWRLPTIKEIYSLMLFSGKTGMDKSSTIPYLDTDYFDFRFGDEYNPSERYIDVQYATTSIYVATIMNGETGMFGLNIADGRIKGYPVSKDFEVKFVRGNPYYGINNFKNNNDGTISDLATGLMWDQAGSSEAMLWEDALKYAKQKNSENYLGFNDWRVPNAKELQSILDYSRSPSTTSSAAIDPLFNVPQITNEGGEIDYPFYLTSTTHEDGPQPVRAVYVCFGRALGFMEMPPGSNNFQLLDVHGAGAQRSDIKTGDPNDYPNGHGPQGDVIRIYNFVRLARDYDSDNSATSVGDNNELPQGFSLGQNYPNPFNPSTVINFQIPETSEVSLKVHNILGSEVDQIVDKRFAAGNYEFKFDAENFSSGIYLYSLTAVTESGKNFQQTKKMILVK
ncbi:MAG: DUF1566 domain-containing protein [Bacteroidetes bacterium]|nr:DUF1566 domain-containing protein [Bacteroidota bacterium]